MPRIYATSLQNFNNTIWLLHPWNEDKSQLPQTLWGAKQKLILNEFCTARDYLKTTANPKTVTTVAWLFAVSSFDPLISLKLLDNYHILFYNSLGHFQQRVPGAISYFHLNHVSVWLKLVTKVGPFTHILPFHHSDNCLYTLDTLELRQGLATLWCALLDRRFGAVTPLYLTVLVTK